MTQQLYQVTYTITFTNDGPAPVQNAPVTATFPPSMGVTWTCAGSSGGVCPGSGAGNIDELVDLPVNGVVIFTVQGALQNQLSSVNAVANIATPTGVDDSTLANNTATLIRYRLVLPIIWKR